MGCGSSNEASSPGGYDDDQEFTAEAGRAKQGGSTHDPDAREDDFFEVEEAEGQEFMAVKPWIGQVAEPDNHNEVKMDKPEQTYALEYVYGYRSADSRQNVHFNSAGQATYMTAALGVILDHDSNTQKFFGGGEVENTSKQVAKDDKGHTNDIMCIKLTRDRTTAATGQVGSSPVIFKWDAVTGELQGRFKLPKGSRGVNAIAWSKDGDYIACVDLHNDHRVYCIKAADMTLVWTDKGGPDKVHDVEFANDSNRFVTVGTKHCYFWNADSSDGEKKKGIFNGSPMTSFCCAAWGDDDTCYTGGANSRIYKWTGSNRTCQGTMDVHKKGFVCTLKYVDGQLYSGAKDGDIHEVDV
jgi:microtubule-associated protein-like 6